VSKHRLVAVDAVRMLVTQNVSVPSQRQVTVETRKVTCMPVLIHRLRVLSGENQLQHANTVTQHKPIINVISWTAEIIFMPEQAEFGEEFSTRLRTAHH